MKKRRHIIVILLALFIVILSGAFVLYRFIQDEDAYNVTEKKYIIDKKSTLISINVINDANVFGRDGKGLFYDFLNDFEEDNNLSFNINTISVNDDASGLSLRKGSTVPDGAKLFYIDHYVLVGKSKIEISNISEVTDTIGYLTKNQDVINTNLNKYSLTLKNYDSRDDLLMGLDNDEVSYIIVPMYEYLDTILDKLYTIEYHLSDIKDYYYLQNSSDDILTSIMSKYYNKWSKEAKEEYLIASEYDLFTDKLKITEKELDTINNKKYRYGFIEYAPYDVKSGGSYGGVMSKYIAGFSKFSGIDIEYDEYASYSKLVKAISNNKVDLFINYYNVSTDMTSIQSLYKVDISIVMNNSDDRVLNNINAIKNETIYVKENSLIASIMKSYGVNVKYYKNDTELKKILKNNNIAALGYLDYLVYKENDKNVNERFRINTNEDLIFNSNNDTMFNRLFTYYISTIDKNEIIYSGIEDYHKVIMSGTLIYKIVKYAFVLIIIIGILIYMFYKIGKKKFTRKKIKRSDKMKYIDILTSLKNRNYLMENIPIWNQNIVYPQGIVVVDLNGIQELNDTYGYQEGDKQIQSAANALIKTQLDNSEIMRTDGNEFTVYLVGYSEKQVISYIKKLNKEFKNLPHDKGAAIGFSMIEDDLKLINDAINEATEKMKENKALSIGEDDVEKI